MAVGAALAVVSGESEAGGSHRVCSQEAEEVNAIPHQKSCHTTDLVSKGFIGGGERSEDLGKG